MSKPSVARRACGDLGDSDCVGGAGELQQESRPYNETFFPPNTRWRTTPLFTDTHILNFPRMFMHTLVISIVVCLISVFFVLCVAFCMSRMRFRFRKSFMNIVLVLGMFPGISVRGSDLLHSEVAGPDPRRGRHRGVDSCLLGWCRRGLLRDEGLHGHDSDVA